MLGHLHPMLRHTAHPDLLQWRSAANSQPDTLISFYRLCRMFDRVRICDCSSDSILYSSASMEVFILSRSGKWWTSLMFRKAEKNSDQMCFFRYLHSKARKMSKKPLVVIDAFTWKHFPLFKMVKLESSFTLAAFVWFRSVRIFSPFAYIHRIAWHARYQLYKICPFDKTIHAHPTFLGTKNRPFE